ncbi:facilitated trehalose transporter Tret1-like isoform X2 [Agrilus planipennis]|uniref:Facilitated trehalose transporter Tret1-like isoform X2 n=1 Tax=Agrilus planipennis TaxID=224129 RepID=A0A1W4WIA9_AGRPL|nr:facilitated trehalose transporter Tret1-like isoform X2 [Agrilus planipennis]
MESCPKMNHEAEADVQTPKTNRRKYLTMVVIASNLSTFASGILLSWTSPVLPRLNTINDNNPFGRAVTPSEQSLISSLLPLGASFGPIFAGLLTDRIGRKKTLLYFTGITLLASFTTLIFTTSIEVYYVARFIAGIGAGNCFVVIPIYLAEISEAGIRGTVTSLFTTSLVTGSLFSYVMGPFVSLTTFNVMCAIFPALFILTFPFCPETPHYLISKNSIRKAHLLLSKLRNKTTENVEVEFKLIKDNVESDMKNKASVSVIVTSSRYRKAFFICLGLFTIQQFSGICAVLFYTADIFKASGSFINPNLSAIIIGTVQLIASLLTPIFVDKLGRKVLLLISASGMFLSELPLGLYYYLKENHHDVSFIGWLPISCLISYIITYIWGFGAVSWIMMGELFSAEVKAIASTMLTSYCWFLSFIVTSLFLNLLNLIGTAGVLWLFTACCFLAIFFTIFCIFETAGKTFQEIQDMLSK